MICDEIRALFSDHLDDALPIEQETALGDHLAECRPCREALIRYETTFQSLAADLPAESPELYERIVHQAHSERLLQRPGIQAWSRYKYYLALIAASISFFVIGTMYGPRQNTLTPSAIMLFPPIDRTSDCGIRNYWPPVPSVTDRANRVIPEIVPIPVSGENETVGLPVMLSARGPFLMAQDSLDSECPVYRTSAGEILLVRVMVSGVSIDAAQSIRIDRDSSRVCYNRASWVQDGRIWSIEGRRSVTDLLALATEIQTSKDSSI